MGYGGDIVWTAVARAYHKCHNRPLSLHYRPTWRDRLLRRKVRAYISPIFSDNPNMSSISSAPIPVYLEDHLWARLENRKMIWKKGGHIVEILCKELGVPPDGLAGEIFYTNEEMDSVDSWVDNEAFSGPIVAIQPDNKSEYFGELRAWGYDNWKSLIAGMKNKFSVNLVQVGRGESVHLKRLPEHWDFRRTAYFFQHVSLFVGTEGGLMHVAAAMKTPSIILWGGITPSALASYPEHRLVTGNLSSCHPCGNLGWCNNVNWCMSSITVHSVRRVISEELDKMPDNI